MAKKADADADTDTDLESALRKAIDNSGLTHYAIGKLSGVAIEAITRFVNRERGLTLASSGKVADALGYSLVKAQGSAEKPQPEVPAKKATRKK